MKVARLVVSLGLLLCAAHAIAVTSWPWVPLTSGACKELDNQTSCWIGVTITETVADDKKKMCSVVLTDANQKVVGIKRGANIFLVWKIDKAPPGYGFDDNDGILIGDPWPRQFDRPGRHSLTTPSTVFWWHDRNGRKETTEFEYEIRVRNDDGMVSCYVPDRWIKNQ